MDIRNALNGYFEKTKVPAELAPQNVSRFVVPKVTEKKEARTAEQLAEDIARNAAVSDSPRPKPVSQPTPAYEEPSAEKAESGEGENDTVIGASAFIKIVRYHKLTGSEFLKVLGNSKISNKAYQEIENNPGLTVKRLIELLEESPLTSADYEKLIIAVQRMAELKAEAKAKIKAEPARTERTAADSDGITKVPESTRPAAGAHLKTENGSQSDIPVSKPKSGVTPKVYSDKDSDGYDEDEDEDDYDEENTGKKKAKKLFLFGKRKNDDTDDDFDGDDEDEDDDDDGDDGEYGSKRKNEHTFQKSKTVIDFGDSKDDKDDEDDEDDEDDDDSNYDSFGRKKKGSNKGKIAAAAVGAVLLVGISFGLRYYFTGSLLPYDNSQTAEKTTDEAGIFDMLAELPSPAPAFVQNTVYSAGGIRAESVLKESVCGNKRLLYISDNKLYIYEQIGGQITQLAVKDYGDKALLGLIDAGDNIAVISTGVSEPYSYSYSVPSESGADTVVTGTVERKETYVEILSSSAPEKSSDMNTLKLSGTLAAAYLHEGRVIAATYEGIEKNGAKEDFATFMPYLSNAQGRQLCAADKVFVSSDPTNGGFLTIYSLSTDGGYDMAAAAGGSAQLISKNGSELFIGQGNTVIRYDLNEGVEENGSCGLSGKISAFSGISAQDGEIRVTSFENSACSLTVLDNELSVQSEIKNIGSGEALAGTCFNGRDTYIITENGTCYGIDGENTAMSQSPVKITNENVYRYSDSIGIKITASDDGSKRTGLTVSTVRLDGSLSTLYSFEISSKTVAVNAMDEYLSSPAEENISLIGGSEENGVAVIPVVYFDGVCEVELFVICTVNEEGVLSISGKVIEYDRQSEKIFAAVDGDTVIAVTKGKIITASSQGGAVQGYFIVNDK